MRAGLSRNSIGKRLLAPVAALALVSGLLTIVVLTPMPADAAASFTVNSTSDLHDLHPGDGTCATNGGTCTLRAAVEEANALPGQDSITVPANTYLLNSQILVEDSVFINGAGMGATVLDGQKLHEVLRIRTIEALVCDSANDSIISFDQHGQFNRTFVSSGSAGLNNPVDIALGSDGTVYATGFQSGVHKYPPDGPPGALFTNPAPIDPTSAQFGGPDFDLFATEFQPGGGIKRFDRFTGALKSTFVPAGSGGLAFPNSLVFQNDDLYVTSTGTNEVLRYNGTTGAFKSTFVSANSGGLDTPRGLAFHNGSLFVVSETNNEILKYNGTTGAFQGAFVTPGSGGLSQPSVFSFGPDGDLYALSSGTKQILRYDGNTGAFKSVFLQGGNSTINQPACIAWRDGTGDGPIVNMSGLDIANGEASVGTTAGLIVDDGATLTATEIAVRDNDSSTFGGGISNEGDLTLRKSQVVRNKLPEGGGGVTSQGGGIFNIGHLDLEQSLVADNFATRGGGLSNANNGQADIVNSTISGNKVFGAGGGIRNTSTGHINISFSTIANNRANEPGGSGEPDRFGGGIYNSNTARISMANSILAKNTDNRSHFEADFAPDCYSPTAFHFSSERDNIVGVINALCDFKDTFFGTDAFIQAGTGDAPLDPVIGPLSPNDGLTPTHALLPGSPAIDGDVAVTSATFFDCGNQDQRGQPRPIDGDIDGTARCDIGAYEFQPPNDNDGVPFTVENGAPNGGDGNNDGIPDRLQPSVASLPAGTGGGYVTVVASDGSVLNSVVTSSNPSSGPLPQNVFLPHGAVGFTVTAKPDATVTITFPSGEPLTSYWKFGSTAAQPANHWYNFSFDGTTGASIAGNVVTLHLRDHARGDDDLTTNNVVVDPGGPGVVDSDNDHLSDAFEQSIGTNPNSVDSDKDGLVDGFEVNVAHSDPLNPDSDHDGVKDGIDPSLLKGVIQSLPDSAFHFPGERKLLLNLVALGECQLKAGKVHQATVTLTVVSLKVQHIAGF